MVLDGTQIGPGDVIEVRSFMDLAEKKNFVHSLLEGSFQAQVLWIPRFRHSVPS